MTDYTVIVRPESTSLQCFAVRALALFGWRVKFAPLPGPRGVVIAYPHTSNWDVVVGLLAKWAVGIHVRWLGKEALFRGVSGVLLAPLLRSWGCEPVERHASTGAIERLSKRIRTADFCWLALAPEGTRQYRDNLRSGFYHIARGAGVPLGLVCLDYARKEVRLVDYITLSGNVEADLARIRAVLENCTGLKPECAAPIRFAEERRETAEQPAK
jgi:1-acyl-sn-glycerol-3-phosphate acyltransferase